MTDKVQKIREEVEKLKSQLIRGACSSQLAMETRCKEEAYNEVLAMLDTMSIGEAIPVEGAMADIEEKAKAFTEATKGESFEKILAEMRGDEPVSEDLKEAYEKYVDHQIERIYPDLSPNLPRQSRVTLKVFDGTDIELAFEAGAKWQKKQDDRLLTIAHIAGAEEGKQMMIEKVMKDAVTIEAGVYYSPALYFPAKGFKKGDKVKIIRIKED